MIKITELEKNLSSDFTLKIRELTINDGERVAVIGPNGSGKSTLLRLVAGVIKPDKGEIITDGNIGYEPQNPYAFKGTAEYNIRLGAGKNSDIEEVLSSCHLTHLRNQKSSDLSGGEKQRMCLARMIAGNYSMLLLDEPMSALDIDMSDELSGYLLSVCEKDKKTLLMTTHLPSQALKIATKILIMNNGIVSEYSDIAELKHPKSEFGTQFIGQWRI